MISKIVTTAVLPLDDISYNFVVFQEGVHTYSICKCSPPSSNSCSEALQRHSKIIRKLKKNQN